MSNLISNFPNMFYSGDNINIEDIFSDYDSNIYDAKYFLINGTNKILINTTKNLNNKSFLISLDKNITNNYNFGFYNLLISFENTNEKITKEIKKIEIKENIEDIQVLDTRNWAEIALSNVEAILQNKATYSQKMYEIAGRKLENYTPKDLIELYNFLKSEVNKLNNIKNKKGSGKIYCKFSNK